MTDILIRLSEKGDIGSIYKIYENEVLHGTATFDKIPPSEKDLLDKRQTIIDHGFPYLVAELGGKVVGYSYVSLYRERSAYSKTVENAIYIDPEFRGMGIASKLMDALLPICEEIGLKQIIAVIGDSENHGSINLHKKLGFRDVGVLENVGYKFERWINVVLMQKSL